MGHFLMVQIEACLEYLKDRGLVKKPRVYSWPGVCFARLGPRTGSRLEGFTPRPPPEPTKICLIFQSPWKIPKTF
jgi:hypothetical protein